MSLRNLIAGLLLPMMTLPGLTACAGEPHSVPDSDRAGLLRDLPGPVAFQVIVKFRDPVFDPLRDGYLAALGDELGISLVYVRPMSAGVHVLRVLGARDGVDVSRAVDLMRERPECVYVEHDRLLKPLGAR